MPKPRCRHCDGPMERVMWGGEMRDPETGKWVPSKRESWRCLAAFEEYGRERRKAEAEVRARFAEHLRWVEVVKV